MNSTDDGVEVDSLEKGLLTGSVPDEYRDANDEAILYDASFKESEDNYVKYQTAQWVLYSLLLILAWGIGVLMLLYLPIRRYILRKDFQSRKLYVTPDAIVYKVNHYFISPCLPVPFKLCKSLLCLKGDLSRCASFSFLLVYANEINMFSLFYGHACYHPLLCGSDSICMT